MLKQTAFWFTVVLLAAGCSQPAMKLPNPDPSTFSSNPSFQDCIAGYTLFTFPKGTGPGTVPSQWGPSPGFGSDVRVELLDCKKVAWGPFERGPIQIMVELHNKGALPANCTALRPDYIYNLERMMVSDVDLANYINATYGIVVDYGIIHVEASSKTTDFTTYSWSWGRPGEKASTLTLGNSNTIAPSTDRAVERWIWINGTGLGIIDVTQSYVAGAELSVVPGEMHAPMLYAQAIPQGFYVGLGDSGIGYQATSKYYRFGDQLCTQPLAS
ncbi:MAG: hypothetical protein QOG31_594 [Thermoplasmata archaeon]|jgi:hypothetical protein|nr:hypothetical protein [Thermoplasmata archaeon]